MKEYYQVLKTLDDSKFIFIKKRWSMQRKLQALNDNIWSLFDLEGAKHTYNLNERFLKALSDEDIRLSVSDFAWTNEVSEAFYKHPANRCLLKENLGMFKLNSEPSTYGEI